jgi:hypothetical protein
MNNNIYKVLAFAFSMGRFLFGVLLGVLFGCGPYFALRELLIKAEDQMAEMNVEKFKSYETAGERLNWNITATYNDENGRKWQCIFEDLGTETNKTLDLKSDKMIKYYFIVPGRYDSIKGEVPKVRAAEMLSDAFYKPSIMTNFNRELRYPLGLKNALENLAK